MTNPAPRPIAENPIFQQVKQAEAKLDLLYQGRIPALVLYGPPGIGKTVATKQMAKRHRVGWRSENPGTPIGLLKIFHKYRAKPVIVIDDVDHLWDSTEAIGILKLALDSSRERFLGRTVGGASHSIGRFRLNCGVVFCSNRDFDDPAQFSRWKGGVEAIRNRTLRQPFSFAPVDLYEYTGWLATEGGMLASIGIDLSLGSTVTDKNGNSVRVTGANRHRLLSRAEANHVLDHFARNARCYPSISPRELAKFAKLRILNDGEQWEVLVNSELLPEPKWELPDKLHRYEIG